MSIETLESLLVILGPLDALLQTRQRALKDKTAEHLAVALFVDTVSALPASGVRHNRLVASREADTCMHAAPYR